MYSCCQGLFVTDLTKLDHWTSFYILATLEVSAAEVSSIYAMILATGCRTAGLTADRISTVDAAEDYVLGMPEIDVAKQAREKTSYFQVNKN